MVFLFNHLQITKKTFAINEKLAKSPPFFPLSLPFPSYKLSFLFLSPLYSPSLSLFLPLSHKIATYEDPRKKIFAFRSKIICIVFGTLLKIAEKLNGMKIKYTPQEIIDRFTAYVEECRRTPFIKQTPTKRGIVDVEVHRPVTLLGFCSFIGLGKNIFTPQEFGKIEGDDVREALARVKMAIESDALSGAQAGVYNASIVARLLNLVDRQDVTTNDKPIESVSVPASIIIQSSGKASREIKAEDI